MNTLLISATSAFSFDSWSAVISLATPSVILRTAARFQFQAHQSPPIFGHAFHADNSTRSYSLHSLKPEGARGGYQEARFCGSNPELSPDFCRHGINGSQNTGEAHQRLSEALNCSSHEFADARCDRHGSAPQKATRRVALPDGRPSGLRSNRSQHRQKQQRCEGHGSNHRSSWWRQPCGEQRQRRTGRKGRRGSHCCRYGARSCEMGDAEFIPSVCADGIFGQKLRRHLVGCCFIKATRLVD